GVGRAAHRLLIKRLFNSMSSEKCGRSRSRPRARLGRSGLLLARLTGVLASLLRRPFVPPFFTGSRGASEFRFSWFSCVLDAALERNGLNFPKDKRAPP